MALVAAACCLSWAITDTVVTDDLTEHYAVQLRASEGFNIHYGYKAGWCQAQGEGCVVDKLYCICGETALEIPPRGTP